MVLRTMDWLSNTNEQFVAGVYGGTAPAKPATNTTPQTCKSSGETTTMAKSGCLTVAELPKKTTVRRSAPAGAWAGQSPNRYAAPAQQSTVDNMGAYYRLSHSAKCFLSRCPRLKAWGGLVVQKSNFYLSMLF